MNPFINIATKAALSAGKIMARAFERPDLLQVSEKRHNDYVTDVDKRSEQEIIQIIRQYYPSHGILAEESGEITGDEYVWIIDPLDGTTNFVHGIPHFSISIALQYRDRLEVGLVYDPMRQELFTAVRGEGAKLNDKRIRVGEHQQFDTALFATGLPFRHEEFFDVSSKTIKVIAQETGDIRRFGSAALDLAYVAAGRFDGYWEYGLAPWDIAAGILLVKEAGGIVTDPQGAENYFKSGHIVASNMKLIKKVLQAFKSIEA
jgi:myo-inositol-1(or 4)-monophosphatase